MTRLLVSMLAVSLGALGCTTTLTCGDFDFEHATLSGLKLGDPYDPSHFETNSVPFAIDRGVKGISKQWVHDGVEVTVSGTEDFQAWLKANPMHVVTEDEGESWMRGKTVVLLRMNAPSSASPRDSHDEWRRCEKKADLQLGAVMGFYGDDHVIRATQHPGIYAEVSEATGTHADVFQIIIGPADPEAFRHLGALADLDPNVTAPAAIEARVAESHAKHKAASDLAWEERQRKEAAERVAARLSPAEQTRLQELNALAHEADVDFAKTSRTIGVDWNLEMKHIYAFPGTYGLPTEEAVRVGHMGEAQWREWKELLRRDALANGH